MPNCPDGLHAGFGIDPPQSRSICSTRTYFGTTDEGFDLYWNGTGHLFRTAGNRSAVATAAHNLYNVANQRPAVSIDLFFGREGGTTIIQAPMRSLAYAQQFATTSGLPEWDFGVIRIDPLDPDAFPPIPLMESTAAADTQKLIIGYPDEDACANLFMPYYDLITVFPCSGSNYGYRGQVETYVGMSGGPLLSRDDQNGVASYGIHVRGPVPGQADVPRASRYSAPVLQRMLGWA